MAAYYNEFEPYAAEWLRNLIKEGLIADGDVDDRSIKDVEPADLRGYTQCHFFAGIGGWSYALRLADWPDSRSVWTGSCPCQPFSSAGRQKGGSDERHLWPEYFRLIRECAPPVVFGEQVAAAISNGWLDAVFADLEAEGYASAAAVLPACSVGAPHIRQRLWFVADAGRQRDECNRYEMAGSASSLQGKARQQRVRDDAGHGEPIGKLGDATSGRRARTHRPEVKQLRAQPPGPWADVTWLPCSDGKARPAQPGIHPLAYGISGRVGRLRAYGNAIVPKAAETFISAYLDARA